jgi:hypothetical protein
VDDLSRDRLRRATAPSSNEEGTFEFRSALAVAAGAFERIDRRYVLRRIAEIEAEEGSIGSRMRMLDSKIRRKAKRAQVATDACANR